MQLQLIPKHLLKTAPRSTGIIWIQLCLGYTSELPLNFLWVRLPQRGPTLRLPSPGCATHETTPGPRLCTEHQAGPQESVSPALWLLLHLWSFQSTWRPTQRGDSDLRGLCHHQDSLKPRWRSLLVPGTCVAPRYPIWVALRPPQASPDDGGTGDRALPFKSWTFFKKI